MLKLAHSIDHINVHKHTRTKTLAKGTSRTLNFLLIFLLFFTVQYWNPMCMLPVRHGPIQTT